MLKDETLFFTIRITIRNNQIIVSSMQIRRYVIKCCPWWSMISVETLILPSLISVMLISSNYFLKSPEITTIYCVKLISEAGNSRFAQQWPIEKNRIWRWNGMFSHLFTKPIACWLSRREFNKIPALQALSFLCNSLPVYWRSKQLFGGSSIYPVTERSSYCTS